MEFSLRRLLDGVASISISQRRQTVEVTFADGRPAFSASAFRDALGETGIEVVAIRLDACGAVERTAERHFLVAGENRFALEGAAPPAVDRPVCVLGSLDESASPYRLRVTTVDVVTK